MRSPCEKRRCALSGGLVSFCMSKHPVHAAPLEVSRGESAGLLGVSTAEQKAFDEAYLEQFGAVGMEATTIVEPKKFIIETENATIQVDPQRSDLVEVKRIDGRRYVLIAVEGEATVNGVEVNIL